MRELRLLLGEIDLPDIEQVEVYRGCGGYAGLERARAMSPAEVVAAVARAGLRRPYGAWTPVAAAWAALPAAAAPYLVVGADDGEPGAFRDRKLIERHPHQLVEGIAIAAHAVRARVAYVCLRQEMAGGRQRLQAAVDQAGNAGLLGPPGAGAPVRNLQIHLHPAGGFVGGEPTALLRGLSGRRPEPSGAPDRMGLGGRPVVVEQVATLAYLPHLFRRGPDWFQGLGDGGYPGTCVYCVSGHVRRPGLYELELGDTTLRGLVEEGAGGVRQGHSLKGVLAGSAFSPVLRPEELDVRLTPADWAIPGGGSFPGVFGSGLVIVMDETTCMVDAALNLVRFCEAESCGQCPACAAGARWLRRVLERLEAGRGRAGDIDLLRSLAGQVSPLLSPERSTLCFLGSAFAWSVQGFLRAFGSEFEQHVESGRCPVARDPGVKAPETVSVRF